MKENASADELQKAKDKAKSDGGEIKHEFTLIKGFTYVSFPKRLVWNISKLISWYISVEFPDDKVGVLQTNEHIHVEEDRGVKTQWSDLDHVHGGILMLKYDSNDESQEETKE